MHEVTENTEELKEAYARAKELLQRMGPYEQVLELACGTGTWTQVLLPIAHDITAIDAAPEMLAIARQSYTWYETFHEKMDLDPYALAYSYMMRSGRLDEHMLRQKAPRFMTAYDAYAAASKQCG